MKKIAATIYKTFVDQGIDLPYFRTIGLMGFSLFIHLTQLSLIFNLNPNYLIIRAPSPSKTIQWVLMAVYFGLIWLLLALIFPKNKLNEAPFTQEEIKTGKRNLWIYLAANIGLLMLLLLVLGIKKGTIKS